MNYSLCNNETSYIISYEMEGKQMKNETKQVCFSLENEIHENFKKVAIMSGNTQSSLANELFKRFNDAHKELIQKYDEQFNFTPQAIKW